jgi:Cu(I)/Ag(I) efflux system periplasmic protein CusF
LNSAKKLAAVFLSLVTVSVSAQSAQLDDHASHHLEATSASSTDVAKTEGEVRKIDKEARKLTLRHGPIPNLEMPEMTMVFRLADPKLLDGLEPNQKVRFTAERLEGQLTVTSIEVVQ